MTGYKQIACALALFGFYALIAGRAPAFSTKGAILAAKIGYNAFSMLAWGGFVGLVVWVLKSEAGFRAESKVSWRWLVVRFISSIVLAIIILWFTVDVRQWAFGPPNTGSWNRPQFAYGWPIPWNWEPLGCDKFFGLLLLDVLFCFSFAFFLCGFRKVKFHIAVYVVPVVLMVILALASGEGGFGELVGLFFGSRHT